MTSYGYSQLGNQPFINREKNNVVDNNTVYIINYNENCIKKKKSFNSTINKYITHISDKEPPIIIICTQNSFSGGEEHFQHYMKDEILSIGTSTSRKYLLFSKIDSIRPINSSNPFIDKCGLRTRIYMNINKVKTLLDLTKFSGKSSQTMTSYTNEFTATKNAKKVDNTYQDIVIEQYKYRRITSETNGKKGIGSIMISMVLKKKNTLTQYIVCNYNVKKQNNNIEENTFNNMLKLRSNIGGTSSFIYIYYISIGKIYEFTYKKDSKPNKYLRTYMGDDKKYNSINITSLENIKKGINKLKESNINQEFKKHLNNLEEKQSKNFLFKYKNIKNRYLQPLKNNENREKIYGIPSKETKEFVDVFNIRKSFS